MIFFGWIAITAVAVSYSLSLDKKEIFFKGENEELNTQDVRIGAYSQYTHVTIEDGITGLGDYCFSGFSYLKVIELCDGITYLGTRVFSECVSLTYLELPDNVKSIGQALCFNCQKVKYIKLSKSLETIVSTRATFQNCYSLEKFIIEGNTKFSTLLDGKILVQDGTTMVGVAGTLASIEIPAIINRIEQHVFSGRLLTKSITFAPGSQITFIGRAAFRYTGVTSMTLPSKLETLQSNIWEYTTSITKVTLPGSLLSVDGNVFTNADNLETVEFTSCTGVYSNENGIIFNQNNAVIFVPGDSKILKLKNTTLLLPSIPVQTKHLMKNITVENGNPNYYARHNLLYKSDKTLFACPGGLEVALIDEDTVCIGTSAFKFSYVRNITFLGNKVTNINDMAIMDTPYLSHIVLKEGLTTLSNDVFNKCGAEGITVTFPSTISSLSNSMFYHSKVKKIDMSKCTKITSLEENFFRDCKYLKTVLLPSTIKSLGTHSFHGDISLEEISMPEQLNVIEESLFEGCTSLKTVIFNGNKCESIQLGAFKNCNLTSITIPLSVKSIAAEAFRNNKYLKTLGLTFDSKLEDINAFAIQSCNSLEEFVIGPKFKTYFPTALSSAMSLKSITVSKDNPYFISINGILYNKNTTYVIACPGGLDYVSIKGNVTTFADSAFFGCSKLIEIDFVGVPLTTISSSAFYGCSSLESISIPGTVSQIQENAFNGCSNLRNVSFQSGSQLEELGSAAFSGCTKLSVVDFEGTATLKRILPSAFANCESLLQFSFPLSVVEIGDSSFSGCAKLCSIEFAIESHLNTIGESAFKGCKSVSKVILPPSLEVLDVDSFKGCSSLKSVDYCGQNDLSKNNAFLECGAAYAYAALNYKYKTIGGLKAFLSLDRDCARPTAAFTLSGESGNVAFSLTMLHAVVAESDERE